MYVLTLDNQTDEETKKFFHKFIPPKVDVNNNDEIIIQVSDVNKLLRDGEIANDESAYTQAFKKFESFRYKIKTSMNLEILISTHSEDNSKYIINVHQLPETTTITK